MCRKDILRALNKVRFGLDSGHEEQCTAEHVNKMFAAGYFQNFANQRAQKGQYLAAGAKQVRALLQILVHASRSCFPL